MASKDDSKRVATTRPENRRGMTKSQIRNERRQRSEARKKRRRTFYIAGGSALAIIFILSLTLSPGLTGNNPQAGEGGNINFGGPVEIDPDAGAQHIPVGQRGTGYAVRPPTSGPHWIGPDTWTLADGTVVDSPADWGVYQAPLPDEVLIHNLEHGGIGLHYNCPDGCADTVSQLQNLMPRSRAQFILAPYPDMESKIAITSWRHHLFLDEFDKAQIDEFIDEYQDRAPESVPGNQYQ